ncbi:MAG TPA: phosphatase PAP2 family protein [Candidatus Limnocylindria bacterium]|nr:phosphatase PAP2 family protein [Candidatus Limnocylindria bacterium]
MPSLRRRSSIELALAAGGVLLVIGLAALVSMDLTDDFDASVIGLVRAPELSTILSPLRFITELGSTAAVTAVAILSAALGLLLGTWRSGLAGAIAITLASLGNSAFKLGIARARPDLLEPVIVEHGFSFPSGHSALGMVAYGVLAVVVSRSHLPRAVRTAVLVGLGLLVGLIGLSRIWLGVHYPTDVLAGWSAGAVVVLVYAALTRPGSPAPAEAPAGEDRAVPRSDPPAPGSGAPPG